MAWQNSGLVDAVWHSWADDRDEAIPHYYSQNGTMLQKAMRIIARRTLRDFVAKLKGRKDQPAVKAAVDAWFAEASRSHWASSAEVKRFHASASVAGNDRPVFNIKGNDYRLVVAVDYETSIIWIKWIGTHAEYDKIDVRKVRYGG
jgi:mRNA interferase HigB